MIFNLSVPGSSPRRTYSYVDSKFQKTAVVFEYNAYMYPSVTVDFGAPVFLRGIQLTTVRGDPTHVTLLACTAEPSLMRNAISEIQILYNDPTAPAYMNSNNILILAVAPDAINGRHGGTGSPWS